MRENIQDSILQSLQKETKRIKQENTHDNILRTLQKEVGQIRFGEPGKVKKLSPPAWQTQETDIVEVTLATMSGEITGDSDYVLRVRRLKRLGKYCPSLQGDPKTRCELAIKTVADTIKRYKKKAINLIIDEISDFVKKPIENEKELAIAVSYSNELGKRRKYLVGDWVATVDTFMGKLQNNIADYRKKVEKGELGAPVDIPEWLKGFASQPLFYAKDFNETPTHSVESEYCRVNVVGEDFEYLLGFEDRDQKMYEAGYPYAPDWDFDEPLVRVTRNGDKLTVKIEKYGGAGISRLMYLDKVLFDPIGGLFGSNVGGSQIVTIPANLVPSGVTPTPVEEVPVPVPVPVEVPESKLKNYIPWIITIGALVVGGIAMIWKKK